MAKKATAVKKRRRKTGGKKTGKAKTRGAAAPKTDCGTVVWIWLRNKDGGMAWHAVKNNLYTCAPKCQPFEPPRPGSKEFEVVLTRCKPRRPETGETTATSKSSVNCYERWCELDGYVINDQCGDECTCPFDPGEYGDPPVFDICH